MLVISNTCEHPGTRQTKERLPLLITSHKIEVVWDTWINIYHNHNTFSCLEFSDFKIFDKINVFEKVKKL